MNNADVVRKFIFRYLSVPLTNSITNIFINRTDKNNLNKFIELNKFLGNVGIIRQLFPGIQHYSDRTVVIKIYLHMGAETSRGHLNVVFSELPDEFQIHLLCP